MQDKKFLKSSLRVSIFQEFFDELNIWYKQIIENNARYIVFLEPKCYSLVLYLEAINNEKLKDTNNKEYLTANSFLARCEEIADYYRKYGKFPRILLCEDFLVDGMNINHILEFFKKNLCNLLTEKDKGDIFASIVAAVNILSITKVSPNLLAEYGFDVKCIIKADKENDINEVNRNISATSVVISRLYQNHSTYSQIINQNLYNQISNSEEWKKVLFFDKREYFKFEYLKYLNQVKVIYSLRLRQYENELRLIPYVFLPNMATTETLNIKNKIFSVLSKDKSWRNIEKEMEILSKENIFYDWLILLMSQIYLKQFNIDNKCNIENNNEDYNDQLIKLMRNYNMFGEQKTLEILDFTLSQTVLCFNDLNSILNDSIKEYYILDIEESKENITENRKNEVKQNLSNYLYKTASIDEKIVNELTSSSYFPTNRRSQRIVRNCNHTLKNLNEGYKKEEIEYMISYFLQMLDSYFISISSYPSKDTKILGFSQFVKVNRQSLMLYPLIVHEYIPLIAKIEYNCSLHGLSVLNEIMNFFNSGKSSISKEEQVRILKFIKESLLISSQEAINWNFNCNRYISYDSEVIDRETRRKMLIEFEDKQLEYMNEYKVYAKNKVEVNNHW